MNRLLEEISGFHFINCPGLIHLVVAMAIATSCIIAIQIFTSYIEDFQVNLTYIPYEVLIFLSWLAFYKITTLAKLSRIHRYSFHLFLSIQVCYFGITEHIT